MYLVFEQSIIPCGSENKQNLDKIHRTTNATAYNPTCYWRPRGTPHSLLHATHNGLSDQCWVNTDTSGQPTGTKIFMAF